jgi:hypothetical protein
MLSCAANSISWRAFSVIVLLEHFGRQKACRSPGKKGALQHAPDYNATLPPARAVSE